MEKRKMYSHIQFNPSSINKAFNELHEYYKKNGLIPADKEYFIGFNNLRIEKGDTEIKYDSEEEYFIDYRNNPKSAYYRKYIGNCSISVEFYNEKTFITVTGTKLEIDLVFNCFENELPEAKIIPPVKKEKKFQIFIGHGRNQQWRELKDHLADKHDYKIIAYEVGARAGHTIRDILDEMLNISSLAFLVMTGEDVDHNGNFHARENVIHEIGLFQGKLGFAKAIVLLEDGTSEFSNIHGIEQIRFKKGNIRETFGDVIAIINREGKEFA